MFKFQSLNRSQFISPVIIPSPFSPPKTSLVGASLNLKSPCTPTTYYLNESKGEVNVITLISHWGSAVAGLQITEHEAAIPHGALIASGATQSRNCMRKFNMASQWSLIFIQMRHYWIHGSKASCIRMIDFFLYASHLCPPPSLYSPHTHLNLKLS